MPSLLRLSEAASLALHTMALMAQDDEKKFSTKEIAATLQRSENHLSKVLQRLTRAGCIVSTRGPLGGFQLSGGWEERTFLDIYEVIEGPVDANPCIAGTPVCNRTQCILGGLTESVNRQFVDYMSRTRLKDLVETRVI